MGSIPGASVAVALILVTIACSWTYVGAGKCPVIRCDNGTTKSPRCKDVDDMDVCFGPITTTEFTKTFSEPPQVHFGLTHIDMIKNQPQRAAAILLGVSPASFDIKWSCEKPSKCYGVDISWIACGP